MHLEITEKRSGYTAHWLADVTRIYCIRVSSNFLLSSENVSVILLPSVRRKVKGLTELLLLCLGHFHSLEEVLN